MLPNETLKQICLALDRFDLDSLEITSRRLNYFVPSMYALCPRWIDQLSVVNDRASASSSNRWVHSDTPKNVAAFFTGALQYSFVGNLSFENVPITERFIRTVMAVASSVRVETLSLKQMNCQSASDDILHKVILAFEFIKHISIDKVRLRSSQLTNECLSALSQKNVTSLELFGCTGVVGGNNWFALGDAGILRFCTENVEGESKELRLSHTKVSPSFFRQIVLAAQEGKLTQISLTLTNVRHSDQEHDEFLPFCRTVSEELHVYEFRELFLKVEFYNNWKMQVNYPWTFAWPDDE
jgi:hypothetical protein